MTFLYFIEQDSEAKPTKDRLAELGLSYIVDHYSELVHGATLNNGPGGKRGVVLMRQTEGIQPRYFPDQQEWRKIAGRWIGWNKSIDVASLKPEQFERDKMQDGYDWTDWKGNKWLIPVARRYALNGEGLIQSYCSLPTYLGADEDGDWFVKGVQTRYIPLWNLACEFEANRIAAVQKAKTENSELVSIDAGDLNTVCDLVFGLNYRLSSLELSVLEILTNQTAIEAMQLVTDFPGLLKLKPIAGPSELSSPPASNQNADTEAWERKAESELERIDQERQEYTDQQFQDDVDDILSDSESKLNSPRVMTAEQKQQFRQRCKEIAEEIAASGS